MNDLRKDNHLFLNNYKLAQSNQFTNSKKNLSFTVLPSGMDPDVLIEKVGPKKFSKFFQDYTIKIENFLIKYLSINLDMKSVSGKATFKRDFNLVLQKLPQSEFKFFLNKYVNDYIYKKKYEKVQIKFEYKDFINRPIYKILTILYHNNLEMEKKLISEFYKNKSRFEKNYGSKVCFAIDLYIKEGSSKKFKSIINEILPFVIIISISFLFRYLINNNELTSMRNIGYSIFDVFFPVGIYIFLFGLLNLFLLNPISTNLEKKYEEILNKKNLDVYSIKISSDIMRIKNINDELGLNFIEIKKIDVNKAKKNAPIAAIYSSPAIWQKKRLISAPIFNYYNIWIRNIFSKL
mgnify:CR=1 FL=1